MDAREGYPLDWFGFYRGIDKADDRLNELIRSLWDISSEADHLNYVFEELTSDAAKIKDEEKREKFKGVLSYLSEQIHELGERCNAIGIDLDMVRECDFIELVEEAEEMAEGEKKPLTNGNS